MALGGIAVSTEVPHPKWTLLYGHGGWDITNNISGAVLSVAYIDKAEHATSTIEVKVEDRDKQWQGPWFPLKGDLLQLSIGYTNLQVLCGLFEIDDLELEGPPDVFHLKGISAHITPDLRTHFSRHYEGQSLSEIAATIAQAHSLTVVGAPATPDVTLARITQKHETDLAFLRRLAHLYGYTFTVRGTELVFMARTSLEQLAPVAVIDRSAVERFTFSSQTWRVYRAAEVSYFDPHTKALITARAEADPPVATGDVLKIPERAESGQDAHAKAEAALHGNNRYEVTAQLTVYGDPRLLAGLTVTVSGFGRYDGPYQLDGTRHALVRSGGYTTSLEAHRVAA
jgi:hypothetical protein